MRELRLLMPRQRASGRAPHSLTDSLTMNSLVMYMAAVILQRLWVLLNSDVVQLLRRLH